MMESGRGTSAFSDLLHSTGTLLHVGAAAAAALDGQAPGLQS